jgi:cell division protein FtsI/penicillin-binding protein 2
MSIQQRYIGLILIICIVILGCQAKQMELNTMTIEQIAAEANNRYAMAIKNSMDKEKAMDTVVDFLKEQKNVKDIQITGKDTVRIFFTDGNDLLLLLGKDRM